MRNFLTVLALSLAAAASAHASTGPGTSEGKTRVSVASHCDKYHERNSPGWHACQRSLMADGVKYICSTDPQLEICKRGQQLSSAEQNGVIIQASLICGKEPELTMCKRGRQPLASLQSRPVVADAQREAVPPIQPIEISHAQITGIFQDR